ncbi:cytochrome c4 [Polynucleobacter paneuropaeus]|nr:cytochrome c4 [Polynucleobacter paneuropaeus]QWD04885.1 cytochrome c4 [Polynucleobacter paneuropaeus]
MKILFKRSSIAILLSVAILAGCTYFNNIPPVTTLENPSRSRTLGDYEVAGNVLAVQVCAACHGVNGQSQSPMVPNLAGQQRDYLVNQLQDYRDRSRSNLYGVQYMWGMAGPLKDKQIQELADYFSKQTPIKVIKVNSDDPQLARGKEIFEKGIPEQGVIQCNSCHGQNGEGMATFPRLAGQKTYYLIQQLGVWQHPDQKSFMQVGGNTWAPRTITFARPRGVLMQGIAKNLSDEDVKAVSVYLSTLN